MKFADVMVGNSSSGIIEAPSFHLPVVNIGIRNSSREHAENVIFVNPERNEIKNAVERALTDVDFRKRLHHSVNPYGEGTASFKTIEVLKEIMNYDTNRLLKKKLSY
jgi:UDP-N-acetylglucosamine 2-epimerase